MATDVAGFTRLRRRADPAGGHDEEHACADGEHEVAEQLGDAHGPGEWLLEEPMPGIGQGGAGRQRDRDADAPDRVEGQGRDGQDPTDAEGRDVGVAAHVQAGVVGRPEEGVVQRAARLLAGAGGG